MIRPTDPHGVEKLHHDAGRHRRPHKETLVVLDLGRHVRPAVTPDDPGRVVELIRRGATERR
jgi:hypothetical protein